MLVAKSNLRKADDVRHDYLPKMCDGCDKAAKCLGGCREAARVFGGSPTAPDPVFEMDKRV